MKSEAFPFSFFFSSVFCFFARSVLREREGEKEREREGRERGSGFCVVRLARRREWRVQKREKRGKRRVKRKRALRSSPAFSQPPPLEPELTLDFLPFFLFPPLSRSLFREPGLRSLSLSLSRAREFLSPVRARSNRERGRETRNRFRARDFRPLGFASNEENTSKRLGLYLSHLFHYHNGAFLCTRPQGELLSFLVDAKKTYTASSIVSLESAFSKLHFGHEHAQDLPLPLSSILAPLSRPPLLSPLSFPLSSRRHRPLPPAREKTQKQIN